MLKLSL
jgi:MFS family permease